MHLRAASLLGSSSIVFLWALYFLAPDKLLACVSRFPYSVKLLLLIEAPLSQGAYLESLHTGICIACDVSQKNLVGDYAKNANFIRLSI